MQVVVTPDFQLSLKVLTKAKYSGVYGSVKEQINIFLKEYSTLAQIWDKNYMLFENETVRINKVRLENPSQNSGRSGGFRLIIICDKKTDTVGLLYVYPKTGPYGQSKLELDFQKKLVKNFSKLNKEGILLKYAGTEHEA